MKKQPIDIPDHPYKKEIINFGGDEMAGLGVNMVGTAVIEYMLNNFSHISASAKKITLSVGGPIIEKIGLFLPHLIKEIAFQRKNDEKNVKKLLKNTFSGGSESFLKDILLHDPLYIAMMYVGQETLPQTPTILLSFVSFVSALLVVGLVKVGFDEGRFRYFCHALEKKGFLHETYYESRIHMHSYEEAVEIFESIMNEYSIDEKPTWEYNDLYYQPTSMKYLGGRVARVRERTRTSIDEVLHTGQLLFTKPREFKTKNIEQYRYFPIKKDKFAFKADSIEEVRGVLSAYKSIESSKPVHFTRRYGNDPKGLLVTMDTLSVGDEKKYVIELKVHNDLLLLKEAIRKVLTETSGEQRTHGKDDL